MAVCYFLQGNFDKSIDKATLSLGLKKTIKGYYRRGKAYASKKNYHKAVEDLKAAIMLDTEDPNDIQTEMNKYMAFAKH